MSSKYTPRLSVDITQEQFSDLQRLLDFGMKKLIFGVIVDDMIRLLKYDRVTFISAILKRRIKLDDMLELELESKDGNPS